MTTPFMHHLTARYGSNGPLLLDATYRTMRNELALFHVMCVDCLGTARAIGIFAVETERREVLAEALRWFVTVAPGLAPPVVVIDKSTAELGAVTDVFPAARVIWCAFHRSQAWHRCVSEAPARLLARWQALTALAA